jgi:hypothetical protein
MLTIPIDTIRFNETPVLRDKFAAGEDSVYGEIPYFCTLLEKNWCTVLLPPKKTPDKSGGKHGPEREHLKNKYAYGKTTGIQQ